MSRAFRWAIEPKNGLYVVFGGVGIISVAYLAISIGLSQLGSMPSKPTTKYESVTTTVSPAAPGAGDEGAKIELKKTSWVKDVYVSPGYMNVGVIRNEKDWTSSMIGRFVCGVLRKNGSNLTSVRFVDIEEVAYQQKSPRQAEISVFACQ